MDPLNVLLLGSGGREHAIATSLQKSKRVSQIFAVPGNAGTEATLKTTNVSLSDSDFPALVDFCKSNQINLVIPGSEIPLVNNISQVFKNIGIPCFGPSGNAAQIEGSKRFAKDFMKRHGIPTASYESFTDYSKAVEYVKSNPKIVIKASGLAAGKGVILPTSIEEALSALESIMVKKEFGSAGNEVVIEELMVGEEVSLLCFSDGYTAIQMPAAQDHKRIFDNDQGPNTGMNL